MELWAEIQVISGLCGRFIRGVCQAHFAAGIPGGFRLRLTKTADCSPALCWAGCCSCCLLQEGCSSFHTTAPKPLAAVPRDQSILFAITINYVLKYTGRHMCRSGTTFLVNVRKTDLCEQEFFFH